MSMHRVDSQTIALAAPTGAPSARYSVKPYSVQYSTRASRPGAEIYARVNMPNHGCMPNAANAQTRRPQLGPGPDANQNQTSNWSRTISRPRPPNGVSRCGTSSRGIEEAGVVKDRRDGKMVRLRCVSHVGRGVQILDAPAADRGRAAAALAREDDQ